MQCWILSAKRYVMAALLATCFLAIGLQLGCRKRAKKSAPKLEVTGQTSEVEERNLRALCSAAAEVRKQPGVQDRLARIAEIAAPTSATTELLDGLIALEGPKRLTAIKQLVAKYGIGQECKDGLPAFEVAADAPAPNAPTPPAAGGAAAAAPANAVNPVPAASPPADSLGVRGAGPVLAPGQVASNVSASPLPAVAPAKAAYGGFRGLGVPVVTAGPLRTVSSEPVVIARSSGAGRPTLALPVGRARVTATGGRFRAVDSSQGGIRGLAMPVGAAALARNGASSGRTVGGIRGLSTPMPAGGEAARSRTVENVAAGPQPSSKVEKPAKQPRFAPGGVRAESTSTPRFAPGGVRAD